MTGQNLFERSELFCLGLSLETVFGSVVFLSLSIFLSFVIAIKRIASRGWRAKREFLPVTPFNASNPRQRKKFDAGHGGV